MTATDRLSLAGVWHDSRNRFIFRHLPQWKSLALGMPVQAASGKKIPETKRSRPIRGEQAGFFLRVNKKTDLKR